MKNSKESLFKDRIYLYIILIISIGALFFCMPPFLIHNTDELGFSWEIINFKPTIFLGRIGFIFFYHLFYKFILLFSNISLLNAFFYLKFFTLILSILSLILIYSALIILFRNRYIAFSSCLLLLTFYNYVWYSGALMTEIPFLFMLVLSLYCLIYGLSRKNNIFILLSAVIFGLGFHFREVILFFLPWTVLLFFVFGHKKPGFYYWYYILFILALLLPLGVNYLVFKEDYLNSFQTYISFYFKDSKYISYKDKINLLFSVIPFYFPLLWLLGLKKTIDSYFQHKKRKSMIFLILTILPLVIYITSIPNYETRYYINIVFIYIIFAGAGLYYLYEFFQKKILKRQINNRIFALFTVIFSLSIIIYNYQKYILPLKSYSLSYLSYVSLLAGKKFPQKAMFLIGDKSWVAGQYLKPGLNKDWEIVYSGWGWPGVDGAVSKINEARKNKIPVFVDRTEYFNWEFNDINMILKKFELRPFISTIGKVE